jgi:hypothetical protein
LENYSDDFYQFRSLTDDFVFCPKCGTKNMFKLSQTGTELNYFCERCSVKLNDYWEGTSTGQLAIAMCKTCQQSTFEELKYCIVCGSIQGKVARKRAREISRTIGDSELRDQIILGTVGSTLICGPNPRFSPGKFVFFVFAFLIFLGIIIGLSIYFFSFWT